MDAKFHVVEEERGNLEQTEPLCTNPNHSELQQKQKGTGKNLSRHGKTTQLVFLSLHIILFILTPYGVCRTLGEVGGWLQVNERVGDDKKARTNERKQTNKPNKARAQSRQKAENRAAGL